MKAKLRFVLPALLAAIALTPAAAQSPYPPRQVRLTVPTPAGGPSDTSARLIAQALSKSLGQSFVVENKPGGSGAIAAQALVAAPPDGHSLMWTLSSMSGLAMLQNAAPYQTLAELTPVLLVGHFGYAMFVHLEVPARSVAEFADHARNHPDGISVATGALANDMASTKFSKITGAHRARALPGGAQLMPDLVSGRVQLYFGPLVSGLPQVRDGRLRLLAVIAPQRNPLAPAVPTLAEAGVAGIAGVALPSWQAIFAPAGRPPEIADRRSPGAGRARSPWRCRPCASNSSSWRCIRKDRRPRRWRPRCCATRRSGAASSVNTTSRLNDAEARRTLPRGGPDLLGGREVAARTTQDPIT